jgi:ubiquinone/menaquinone biosynthesis C-methylase UbiE
MGDLMNIVACPKCKSELKASKASKKLSCTNCKYSTITRNGIPLLTYFPLKNKQDDVREMFNATPYGLVGSRDAFENKDKIDINTIQISPWYLREKDVKGKKMLEAGCGGGHLYTELSLLGADIVGLDQTPNSLEHIRKLFEEYEVKPKLVNGNIEEIPFKENTFDIVTSMGVIHHTPRTQKALNNLARVTKKGGTVHIMVYHKHSVWNYVKNVLRIGCKNSKLFSKLIFTLTRYWMGITASQSNQETVFRDNMVNAITKSYSAKELRKMSKRAGLKVKFLSRYELPELYCFSDKIYQSPLLRWYEKRFGWFLYAKMEKI